MSSKIINKYKKYTLLSNLKNALNLKYTLDKLYSLDTFNVCHT